MSEGVVFTSLEHSAPADALAVLRPRLPARGKAAALVRAFGYAGRPYDYDFDFQTDAALVVHRARLQGLRARPRPPRPPLGRPPRAGSASAAGQRAKGLVSLGFEEPATGRFRPGSGDAKFFDIPSLGPRAHALASVLTRT